MIETSEELIDPPMGQVPLSNCIEIHLVWGLKGHQEYNTSAPDYNSGFDLLAPVTQDRFLVPSFQVLTDRDRWLLDELEVCLKFQKYLVFKSFLFLIKQLVRLGCSRPARLLESRRILWFHDSNQLSHRTQEYQLQTDQQQCRNLPSYEMLTWNILESFHFWIFWYKLCLDPSESNFQRKSAQLLVKLWPCF